MSASASGWRQLGPACGGHHGRVMLRRAAAGVAVLAIALTVAAVALEIGSASGPGGQRLPGLAPLHPGAGAATHPTARAVGSPGVVPALPGGASASPDERAFGPLLPAAAAGAGSDPLRGPDTVVLPGSCLGNGCATRTVGRWQDIPFAWPPSCPPAAPCPLLMDVYAPYPVVPAAALPVVVMLPGGPSDPTQFRYLQDLAVPLASRGAVVITAGWRMRAQDGGGYPQSFAEVGCAVGVARALAPAYGGVSGRVTLVGHSLGAWAAEVVALTPTAFAPAAGSCAGASGSLRPDALVSIDGAPWGDFDEVVGADYLPSLLGGDPASQALAWAAVDPFALMAEAAAVSARMPVLVVQGLADTLIDPSLSQALDAALQSAGYDSRLVLVPGADHGSVLAAGPTVDAVAQFVGAP